jgi:cobalt-zinc-cadmium efflux system protein
LAHSHDHGISAKQLGWRLIASLAINVVILVTQLIGGVLAGSLALITDALHNVTDVASLGLSYGALRVGERPPNARYTFAFQRAEVLAAVVNAAALIGVSVYIFIEAIQRLRHPSPVAGLLVMGFAAFGMIANGLAALMLRGQGKNLNLRSAMLHLVSDSVASLGVLLAGAVIVVTGQTWIDPAISIALATWMTWESVGLIREAAHILMEGVPEEIEISLVEAAMVEVEGVVSVHDLHVWAVSPENVVLSAHVVVDQPHVPTSTRVVASLKAMLHDRFDVEHATLEVECTEGGCAGTVCATCEAAEGQLREIAR